MKRTAVVFDMDGLMVDTEPLSRQAWEQVLQVYDCVLNDEVYSQMIGLRADESARMVIKMCNLPLSVDELIARKSAALAAIYSDGVPMMPGLMALQAAIARRGLLWAVATSSARQQAEAILTQLGLHYACSAVAGGDEVERGKPAPDIYILVAKRLNLPPESCLALEDSAPGCRSAAEAGMRVVAVPNGVTRTADFGLAYSVCGSLYDVADRLDDLLVG